MNNSIRLKLSAMMFLEFFIWGAWYVTAPNYLGTIGFKAADFGWTYSVGPIAGMITPFFVGMIADRFFPAQRVLGVMHLLGAALMFGAISLMKVKSPVPNMINLASFGYMLTYFPTLALTNTIAMRNMGNAEKEFPLIRVAHVPHGDGVRERECGEISEHVTKKRQVDHVGDWRFDFHQRNRPKHECGSQQMHNAQDPLRGEKPVCNHPHKERGYHSGDRTYGVS